MKRSGTGKGWVQAAVWFVVVASLATGLTVTGRVSAQSRTRLQSRARASHPVDAAVPPVRPEEIESAMGFICSDRRRDPLGSAPIDLMQARPSLAPTHPDAQAGVQRARRLLPLAKELTIKTLHQLATQYGFSEAVITVAARRVLAVTQIKPDPDLRDNASVMMNNPQVINFGTIFLVGLPSDEGMISVLCHELTHIADGREGSLGVLFARIGRRAAMRTGLEVEGQRAEELSCDLVGATSVQTFIGRQYGSEAMPRRLARAIEHNCVDSDETDDEHLSPRSTMRALLALNPGLTRTVVGALAWPASSGSRGRQMNLIELGILR